jgi:hypothetical protein
VSTVTPPEEHVLQALAAVPAEVEKRAALEQVLATSSFERAEQLRSFLRYICEMEIAGRGGELSEYLIGIEALGKRPGYSTGDDAGVRKRAHDLRQRLEELYAGELAAAPVRIELPKGRYAPRFFYPSGTLVPPTRPVPAAVGEMEALPVGARRRALVKVFWLGFAVGIVVWLAGERLWARWHPPRQVVADPGRVVEAEDRSNELGGGAVVGPCPACSGRGRVKWIGRDGFLAVPVEVPSDGDYMLQVDYLVEGPRTLFVGINGAPGIELPLRGSHWWIPASTSLMVRLHAGRNILRFSNPRTYAPDLDRIVIR